MTIDVIMSKLFDFSKPTYFRWKKEKRPIISLLDRYFSKEELEEYLNTGKIQKFENEIHINLIAQKLYNFKRRSLSYLYFLISNDKINNVNDFNSYVQTDIDNIKKSDTPLNKIISFLKSMKWDFQNDFISYNTYAQEFNIICSDIFSKSEINFILSNKEDLKAAIELIVDKKMYKP